MPSQPQSSTKRRVASASPAKSKAPRKSASASLSSARVSGPKKSNELYFVQPTKCNLEFELHFDTGESTYAVKCTEYRDRLAGKFGVALKFVPLKRVSAERRVGDVLVSMIGKERYGEVWNKLKGIKRYMESLDENDEVRLRRDRWVIDALRYLNEPEEWSEEQKAAAAAKVRKEKKKAMEKEKSKTLKRKRTRIIEDSSDESEDEQEEEGIEEGCLDKKTYEKALKEIKRAYREATGEPKVRSAPVKKPVKEVKGKAYTAFKSATKVNGRLTGQEAGYLRKMRR